ncbi:CARDB domain-containing protein [Streptomyces sp. NPDC046712]|uniref:CARDB domain-containing protein n=1 Tax=Streptomyces sp. NPDC046712 TaxID=3154802 RepID=UPI0033E65992
MRKPSAGRVARLGACVTAAGLFTVGMAATPAAADSDQLWITAPYEVVLPKAADSGTQTPATTVALGLSHDNDTYRVTDGRLTVDVSGLAGLAEVTWPENCAPTGTTAVCSFPEVPLTGFAQVHLKVRAASGVDVGAGGQITYRATATTTGEGGVLTASENWSTVRVASGPDLILNQPTPVSGVTPGSTVPVPFSVVNNGNERADGVQVSFYVSRGLDVGAIAPQCTSTPLGEGTIKAITMVDCAFDDVVEPGGSFTLPSPLQAKVAPFAFAERIDMGVRPGGGVENLSPEGHGAIASISATNTADFAVRGARLTAAAGETVRADVTFRNRGPAWIANLGSGEPVGSVDVTVPRGATVTAVPDACEPRTADGGWWESEQRTGAPRYLCQLPIWVAEKQTVTFPFDLRVDTVVTGAKGAITLKPSYGSGFPHDPNAANNKAKLVLNPAV